MQAVFTSEYYSPFDGALPVVLIWDVIIALEQSIIIDPVETFLCCAYLAGSSVRAPLVFSTRAHHARPEQN